MSLISLSQNSATIGERLQDALVTTPSLIADIISEACRRLPSQGQAGKTERIEQLIKMGAWTDAALALIELELPQWHIRRVAHDDGEWYCALSHRRELPDWLDESAEACHTDLALAILGALVEAQRLDAEAPRANVPCAPQSANARYQPMLIDNFA